jgi:hypothetical protein
VSADHLDQAAVETLKGRLQSLRENPPVEKPHSATNKGVPHISLVFREMWDTTDLDWQSLGSPRM